MLGLRGCERSLRHGYDGRFDPGERLACRLSGQPVRGYADLLSGDEVLAPFAHGGLPAECGELLREAALSDPDAVDELSGLVPSSRGWTKAQIRARLRAEMVLDYYVHGRQEDVGELLDASLKEGVEPSPVGMTYWRQPWIPLYAEWSASLKHTDRVTGWSLSEVDFDTPGEDELHALALDTVTLSGRSLLNSSGARTLASAVDAFLHAETRLDEDGRGVLSDADADDLAQLALVAARSDVLSAALDGVNDHFLGFDADTAFADPDADAPVVSPARLPQLLRAGWLRLERLRVVDAFGRYLDLDAELTSLTRADTLVGDRAPDFAAPAAAPPAQLPPRFTAPARLQLRFLDAADDDAEARVDESSAFVAGNPVAGWLLPDHADDALEFFDAEGSPLGQLFHRGVGSDVTWEGAPGKPGPLGAGPNVDLAGSRHLSRLAVAVVQRDAVDTRRRRCPGREPARRAAAGHRHDVVDGGPDRRDRARAGERDRRPADCGRAGTGRRRALRRQRRLRPLARRRRRAERRVRWQWRTAVCRCGSARSVASTTACSASSSTTTTRSSIRSIRRCSSWRGRAARSMASSPVRTMPPRLATR